MHLIRLHPNGRPLTYAARLEVFSNQKHTSLPRKGVDYTKKIKALIFEIFFFKLWQNIDVSDHCLQSFA